MSDFVSVPGYENLYQVNMDGVVRSLDRIKYQGSNRYYTFKGRILKQAKDKDGYNVVAFYKDGKQKPIKIHRLVAKIFLPMVDGKNEVNHKDGNKTNNNVSNLEWVTHKENQSHASRIGKMYKSKEHREKIRIALTGKKKSLSHIENIKKSKRKIAA